MTERSFLSEMSRRKVWKVGAAYLVVAWLAVQAASIAFPAFDAPAWALRIFILVALLGFPLALIFAWALEVTPEGVKVDTASTSSRLVLSVALGFIALAFVWYFKGQPSYRDSATPPVAAAAPAAAAKSTKPPISANSIAVMPFLNMSADPEQEYFSDGMTEEILNALAKVPRLQVTARTSVFSLKGQRHDVRELGTMLGVAYLLEGSVRKAGGEVRITAQLIRTDNGFHLWSETYDRKLENIFDLQTELAGAIAQALQLPLGMGGSDGLVSDRTTDPEAYSLYLQARSAYRARGDGVAKSIELYRAALQRDPKFARAWAGLCSSLVVQPWYVGDTSKLPEWMREAERAGLQALALAPDLPQAHTALATLYTFQWKWAEAGKHFERALILAPDDPEVHYNHADWLAAQGRFDEALRASQRVVALDPLVPIFINNLANKLADVGRKEESLALRRSAYALAPEVPLISNNLVSGLTRAGKLDEAGKLLDKERPKILAFMARNGLTGDPQAARRAAIELKRDPGQAEAIRKRVGEKAYRRAQGLLGTDVDAGFEGLAEAMDRHTHGADPVIQLRRRVFDGHRQDPRYLRLLAKAGLDAEGNIP